MKKKTIIGIAACVCMFAGFVAFTGSVKAEEVTEEECIECITEGQASVNEKNESAEECFSQTVDTTEANDCEDGKINSQNEANSGECAVEGEESNDEKDSEIDAAGDAETDEMYNLESTEECNDKSDEESEEISFNDESGQENTDDLFISYSATLEDLSAESGAIQTGIGAAYTEDDKSYYQDLPEGRSVIVRTNKDRVEFGEEIEIEVEVVEKKQGYVETKYLPNLDLSICITGTSINILPHGRGSFREYLILSPGIYQLYPTYIDPGYGEYYDYVNIYATSVVVTEPKKSIIFDNYKFDRKQATVGEKVGFTIISQPSYIPEKIERGHVWVVNKGLGQYGSFGKNDKGIMSGYITIDDSMRNGKNEMVELYGEYKDENGFIHHVCIGQGFKGDSFIVYGSREIGGAGGPGIEISPDPIDTWQEYRKAKRIAEKSFYRTAEKNSYYPVRAYINRSGIGSSGVVDKAEAVRITAPPTGDAYHDCTALICLTAAACAGAYMTLKKKSTKL